MLRPCRVALLVCAALCLADSARAADWPVPRGPSHEPAPYRYDAARWKKVPPSFLDDATACTLYSSSSYLVEADGTIETIVHDITRLNSRKGIDKLGEYRNISFDPAFEKLTLNVARVHKANGKIIDVRPRDLQLRDVATDYQVYDPEKQLIISFPSLEVGDVIEVKWTTRGKNPEHGGQFFTRYSFGSDDYPVVRDELRVRLPVGRALKHATLGGKLAPVVIEREGFRLYVWRADNNQQMARDEDKPSKEEMRLRVACSTFGSWEEIAAWKRKLRADCWECTPTVKKTVAEVTRDLKTPASKARALTYWVRKNVRYLSAGLKHDYTPNAPSEVLANRQGDCKDTSQLLAVMLREAGIPVALVTLGTRDDGQVIESVPSPWGTHAILLVTLDGKDHWIDTTATLAAWDFLPRNCRDRLCYVLDDKGIRLKRTPLLTATDHRYEQVTHVTIASDGSSRSVRKTVYYGLAAYNQRDRWLEVPPGEQRRLTATRLQDSNSQTRLCRLDIGPGLGDFDKPVRAAATYEVPGQFAGKDREGSVSDGKVWTFLLGYTLDYDRKVPLEMYGPVDTRHRYVVKAPPGFEFDGLPREHKVRSQWGAFTRRAKWIGDDARTIQVDFRLRLDKVRVEPADFDAFRAFHKDVNESYRAWLTLERVWRLEHAAELEATLALAPEDSAGAETLTQLYLRHDRDADARRVLRRARYYRPSVVALWELSVKAAESKEAAEKMQRELVRRFPQDPTHAIALGAMLIDRGRYALAEPVLEALAKASAPPARSLASYQLARSRFKQGKAERALEHLKEAAKYEGDKNNTVAVEMLRGRVCQELYRPAEARKAYEKAYRTDPKAEDALLALIELCLSQKDRPQAARYLSRYIALVDDNFKGLIQAADYALRLGRYGEAFDLASRAREQNFHESVQRILGMVALHRGQMDKAVFHLERADPSAEVLEAVIRAKLALGQLSAAEREVQRAGLIPMPPPKLKAARQRTKKLIERREELLKDAGATRANRAEWLTAADYCVCAEEALRQGRPAARVETLLTKAAGTGKELGLVYGLKGRVALSQGRLREALAAAEKAVALSPCEASAWYVRGRVRLEREAPGALSDLQKAAELSKRKDADVLRALAEAQMQAGQAEQARQTLQEALKLRPGNKGLAEQLKAWQGSAKPQR
jgi:tetratricopeptide (TPR) repeat protein